MPSSISRQSPPPASKLISPLAFTSKSAASMSPLKVRSPVTVALSAIVVSEVECPIVTAIPLVSVAIFNAPVVFAKYEFDPS